MTPPYNGWYETYKHHFDDLLTKADNLNTNLPNKSIHLLYKENLL